MIEIKEVGRRGEMVIPRRFRDVLGLDEHSKVRITLEKSKIVIEPVTDEVVEKMRGMFGRRKIDVVRLVEESHVTH
ncbi:MAG: AbrB/MazE/SpoVT family DNA-binding domain-containing protein [Methanocellales archaeon]|nr:AbrB/MazE/SpoVT family DNA-binding domain-containing protein [Methanocellales archaeon]MDI6639886.1 AbrB/MazE/SpoVT family DNA-binding domain-containing protein [Methanocellales archaeon]MDI6903079.1 AbrB/MazE/SpoVT family DNA-binding domain-containing protein [Methanocellales archaeon]